MAGKGLYPEFHEWLHNSGHGHQGDNIMGRLRMSLAVTDRVAKFFGR